MIISISSHKVLSFTLKTTYNQARTIADAIIIALIKYERNGDTYSSTVNQTFMSRINNKLTFNIFDDSTSILTYRITIYQMPGNRRSLLSASQNPIYDEIIATKEMTEIIERLNINIGDKKNEQS